MTNPNKPTGQLSPSKPWRDLHYECLLLETSPRKVREAARQPAARPRTVQLRFPLIGVREHGWCNYSPSLPALQAANQRCSTHAFTPPRVDPTRHSPILKAPAMQQIHPAPVQHSGCQASRQQPVRVGHDCAYVSQPRSKPSLLLGMYWNPTRAVRVARVGRSQERPGNHLFAGTPEARGGGDRSRGCTALRERWSAAWGEF